MGVRKWALRLFCKAHGRLSREHKNSYLTRHYYVTKTAEGTTTLAVKSQTLKHLTFVCFEPPRAKDWCATKASEAISKVAFSCLIVAFKRFRNILAKDTKSGGYVPKLLRNQFEINKKLAPLYTIIV